MIEATIIVNIYISRGIYASIIDEAGLFFMKRIALSQGKFALVDDEDFEKVNKFKWHYTSLGYAVKNFKIKSQRKILYLHRIILNAPKHLDIDHINHNRLDNRKENLRLATRSQNMMNRGSMGGTSRYKGVHFISDANQWHTQMTHKNKKIYIGIFKLERHAAMAYDLWAKELHGKFAYLNFPVSVLPQFF